MKLDLENKIVDLANGAKEDYKVLGYHPFSKLPVSYDEREPNLFDVLQYIADYIEGKTGNILPTPKFITLITNAAINTYLGEIQHPAAEVPLPPSPPPANL